MGEARDKEWRKGGEKRSQQPLKNDGKGALLLNNRNQPKEYHTGH
jgi:hypothetical protein